MEFSERLKALEGESGRTPVLYKTFAAGVSGGQKFIENPFGTKQQRFVAANPEVQNMEYEAARQAYLAENPPIPLEEAYTRLRAKVAETQHGRAFLAKMDQKLFESFPWLTEKPFAWVLKHPSRNRLDYPPIWVKQKSSN
jgi:hypothetical protein